jgi:UPF0755 protein
MDIRPPQPQKPDKGIRQMEPVIKRPLNPIAQPQQVAPESPQPIESLSPQQPSKKPRSKKRILLFSMLGLLLLVLLAAAGAFALYTTNLSAVGSNKDEYVKVTIEQGTAPSAIGQLLQDKGVIKSSRAFSIYTRITKTQNSLQAGAYRLSPSESTPEIVKHLTSGSVDTFSLTFLPGATVAEDKKVLLKAGFTQEAIDTAFAKTYDSPLFAGKPASADLEGYVYGETYSFGSDVSVEDVLGRTFQQFNAVVQENGLEAKFKARGLTLYEGITLASVIQRESIGGDEAQIAQIFYRRLSMDMPLGSDVTYQYIADKTGVARDPDLDSPYNTRKYPGLPPGPIAAPGLAALKAVADPAAGEYVYFLSGDDDVTYFAKTLDEHEANISAHCKVKCSIL